MNPIPEPNELLEAECNAQGLYGLPPDAFAHRAARTRPDADTRVPALPSSEEAPGASDDPHD